MRRSLPARWRNTAYRDGIPRPVGKPAAGLVAVLLAAAAAGCAGTGGSPTATGTSPTVGMAPSATSTSASVSPPNVHLVEITISGRTVSPPTGRVNVTRGEKVRLVVHSDAADEVHVHGYDLEARVAPGADAVTEFVADQAGLFEVETHNSNLVLTQLLVQ